MGIFGIRNIDQRGIGPISVLTATVRSIVRFSSPLLVLVTAFTGSYAFGADCPNAKTALNGFVLERPGVRTVVRQSAEQIAIFSNDYASASPQTQFLVGGLIEVFRTSNKEQFVALPMSDFREIFPLEKGKEQEVNWLWLDARNNRVEPRSLSLKVTGKETIKLGGCSYKVLAVRQLLTGGQGQALDALTALYSPDLRAVLGKRYDEGTAKENTIAFETIRSLDE